VIFKHEHQKLRPITKIKNKKVFPPDYKGIQAELKIIKFAIFLIICAFWSIVYKGGGILDAYAKEWRVEGFSWIGNNLVNGIEQRDPVIGMIKMNGSKYRVSIEGTGPIRLIKGAAWLGIGSLDDKYADYSNQGDFPSLGWMLFNKGIPSDDCFGAGDCYPARWNQKAGVASESMEGYISGWAKMQIGPNGDNSAYSDVWVHFKTPDNISNYTCDNENHYYVCVDGSGGIRGYAWSAGANETAIDGNPGFGWIKFSEENVTLVDPEEVYERTTSSTCQILLVTKSTICGTSGTATYRIFFQNLIPKTLTWKYVWVDESGEHLEQIVENGPFDSEIIKKLSYPVTGYYTPQLTVLTEDGEKIGPCNEVPFGEQKECCASFSEVKITDQKTCEIVPYLKNGESVPKLNPLDPNSRYKVIVGQEVVAKTELTCVEPTSMNWNVLNGDMLFYTKDSLTSLFDVGGLAKIGATATETTTDPDTGLESTINVACDEAQIQVKEKMRYGF